MKDNIKEGYKDSALGVIPDSWEVAELGNVTVKIGDGIHSTPKYVNESNYYFINGNNLIKGRIVITCKTNCVSREEYATHVTDIKLNSILMSINGTIGNLAYYKGENVVLGKSAAYILSKEDILNNYFLYYLLQIYVIKEFYKKELTGTTIRNLSLKTIRKTPVFIPPLKEQKKIAKILSTVDKKIDIVEQQIKETKELKKGLMQKLLVKGIGHTKFKDSPLGQIPHSWEVVKLGDVVLLNMGQSPSSSSYNDDEKGLPLIQGNADIKNRVSMPRIWTKEVTKECNVGDVIMTVRAPVGAIALSKHNACIGRGVCAISSENINQDYLYQYLVSYESKWDKLSQGSTFTAVNGADIKGVLIPNPPLKEQKKIAEILSTVDDKIDILEKKRSEIKDLKKGLMQQLLTGKIRVNLN